jgi:phosphatidylglycerophosphate synthase
VVAVRTGLSVAGVAVAALLGGLVVRQEISLAGVATGLACATVLATAVARSASRRARQWFGPADLVTLTRATIGCGVAALVADSFVQDAAVWTLTSLTVVALALDAVDGRVARATRTASAFGATLDGETDAFLMLVLTAYVARFHGAWVLSLGAFRYVFAMAGWLLPWMRAQLPRRYWRKVVTATAGIALAIAVADVAPGWATSAALALALVLLVESFGRDVGWLWRHRVDETGDTTCTADGAAGLAVPSS